MSEITWRDGYRSASKVNAADAYEAVEAIRLANNRELSPWDVVEAARDAGSPLHCLFEWSDSAAAVKYREEQARGMLRAFCVVRGSESEVETVRVYQFVKTAKGPDDSSAGKYWPLEDALKDPEHRRRIIGDLKRELRNMAFKFRQIKEMASVWRAVDRVLQEA
jgi:hypothetical protein